MLIFLGFVGTDGVRMGCGQGADFENYLLNFVFSDFSR